MLFAGLVEPPPGYSPLEYREYVKACILPHIDDVLSVEDFVILYSGPSDAVWRAKLPDTQSNNRLSANMARSIRTKSHIKASRINDTSAAKALYKHDLNKYFLAYFKKRFPSATTSEIKELQNAAYAEVWGGISELFAKREFRHAATAVCGADHSRVFVKEELPALIATNHLKTINGIRFEAVKRIYNEVSPDDAFRLVCLSEINYVFGQGILYKRAATVRKEAQRRISYYQVERNYTEPRLAPLTGAQKLALKSIQQEFGLNALYVTHPKTWSRAVKRPLRLSLLVSKMA